MTFAIASGAMALQAANSPPAAACGTIRGLSDQYWDTRTSETTRRTIVRAFGDICGDYVAYESDAVLMAIFRDAVARGYDSATIRKSFEAYWCLAGSRGRPDYAALVASLGESACPTETAVRSWYVVKASGANIRKGPDTATARTGVARRGTLVERLESRGDWLFIRRMTKDTGYIHASLLSPFRKDNR
jgi:hypothetical protein